ncbi:Secretion protein HlyD [Candidatus Omnitrophus magneticus]|uniref:Secretion protein HlyD n=1 Tax=Candidatus Omnitrophus magneticus TaxID=1609969 RepID=A0A0F0CWB5_9BACT|nr:Secretion protein HlyD [Candidatus Omnitrophus magneticus]
MTDNKEQKPEMPEPLKPAENNSKSEKTAPDKTPEPLEIKPESINTSDIPKPSVSTAPSSAKNVGAAVNKTDNKKQAQSKIPLQPKPPKIKKPFKFPKINFKQIARWKKFYIWALIILLTTSVVVSKNIDKIKNLFGKKDKAVKEMTEFSEELPVKVYKTKKIDFKDTLPVMGRIEGFTEIELRFETNGIIESFNFEEGERILEGDIITSLNQKDALLKLKYAALDLEKAKKLYELGGYDKVAYDQKQLEYESAKRDLEKTNIYSPSDGYLGSKEKMQGTYVTSQDKCGTFLDFSQVYAVFDIIEEDTPKIKQGQNVDIFVDSYPGETFTGTIDMLSPMIQGRTRTQKAKIELENKDDLLKPGMFARAVINTYEKKDALIIPNGAFKKKEQKYFVYVVHPEEKKETEDAKKPVSPEQEGAPQKGVVEEREIKIAYLTHDMAEVGKGLEEGELVIRELHQDYKDQDKVEITEVQETIF